MNSRQKGKRGELEAAHVLKELGLGECRRGVQYHGGPESPDVVGVNGFHVEVKRVERLQLDDAMDQSIRDAGEDIPVVMHRRSRKPWLITMRAADWAALVKQARAADGGRGGTF